MATNKVICIECQWHGTEAEMLTAPNPFSPDDGEVNGCPKCFAVSQLVWACEHADCWREASCGTPVPDGYAQTCGKHQPPQTEPKHE